MITSNRNLVLEFTKMHGAGNDFVIIDNRFYNFSKKELGVLAGGLCPRKTAIGADGLLALENSDSQAYRMAYYNADGSRASMCGNGARCLARFAKNAGIEGDAFSFDSDAGVYRAEVPDSNDEPVTLHVPSPRDLHKLDLDQNGYSYLYIWTGTPHVVAFVDDLSQVDVAKVAPPVRHHDQFQPEGTNVNFAQVAGPDAVALRTFEKGVEEETDACGTGALAAAMLAHEIGEINQKSVRVHMRGGELIVGFDKSEGQFENVYLKGSAEVSFRGSVKV